MAHAVPRGGMSLMTALPPTWFALLTGVGRPLDARGRLVPRTASVYPFASSFRREGALGAIVRIALGPKNENSRKNGADVLVRGPLCVRHVQIIARRRGAKWGTGPGRSCSCRPRFQLARVDRVRVLVSAPWVTKGASESETKGIGTI